MGKRKEGGALKGSLDNGSSPKRTREGKEATSVEGTVALLERPSTYQPMNGFDLEEKE
jgi:hypothetical protein